MLCSWLKVATAALACLLQVAHAQQYMGDTINNSLPYVPGSEIAYFRITDPSGKNNNLTLTNYYSLQQSGKRLVPSAIQRLVVIIHGLDRDPGTYMSNMLSALSQVTTDSNVNFSSVAIMAPYFPNGDDKNIGYPWTDGLKAGRGSTSNALVWKGSQWSGGGQNQYPYTSTTISSYDVLDQIIQYYDNKTLFPDLQQIVIAGHSLGGQTVQRYCVVGKQLGQKTPVTYWIANPNSYAWLSLSRPLDTSSCPGYDAWREGLSNYTDYPMSYNTDLVVTQGRAAVLANFNAKNKNFARGTQDDGDDSSSCSPFTAGANRNERFFNFIKQFPATCPDPYDPSGHCDTIDLINAGHDGGAMMASDAGRARLFLDNFYGNGSKAYDFGYPREQTGDDPFPNPALNATSSANETVYSGNMTYHGCWTDAAASTRSLSYMAYDSSSNTIELCTSTCAGLGYNISGLEYGSQCWCSDALTADAEQTVDSGCTQPCAGNSSETCGNSNRLSIYSNGYPDQLPLPGNPESVGNYFYLNCYTEATSGRALSAKSTSSNTMTLETCAAFCNGYEYFGIEYASECYCGGYFNAGSAATTGSDCSMTCSGDNIEICGGPNRLSVYQLSSGATVTTITQAAPSTTSSVSASSGTATGSTTSASAPAASNLCPTADGEVIVDSNGQGYTVHCSSDSSQGSYTSASASTSYLDCMAACDAASSTSCIGFTYVGGALGSGSGTCWLKTGMGSYTTAGSNYISGVKYSNTSSSSSTVSTSTTSTSSTSGGSSTVSSTTSSTSAAATNLCPSTDGKTITDANGVSYTVHCSSDSDQGSYTSAQASSSYLDCMVACDAASSTGCVGFTYVGGSYGSGSGTCWLKTGMGNYLSTGNNYIAAVKAAGTSSSSSTTVVSTSSVSSTASSSSLSSSSTTTSGTTTSSASLTTSITSTSSSSASASATALSCPASNNTIYTASSGKTFQVECGIDHNAGDMGSTTTQTLEECIAACDAASGCVDVSLSGVGCYLKSSLGYAISNPGLLGAKLVTVTSSSSSATPSSTSSSSSSSTRVTSPSTTISTSTVPSATSSSTTSSVSSTTSSSPSSTTLSSTTSSSSSVTPTTTSSLSTTSSSSTLSSTTSSSVTSSSVASSSSTLSSTTSSSTTLSSTTLSSTTSSSITTSSTSSSSSITSSSTTSSSTTSSSVTSSSATSSSTSSATPSTTSTTSSVTTSSTSASTSSASSTTSSTSSVASSTTSSSSSTTSAAPTTTSSASLSSSSTSSSTTRSSTSSSYTPTLPSGVSVYGGGCFVDSSSSRALSYSNGTSTSNTPAQCASNCAALGYAYAGTEYSNECWCSSTAPTNVAAASDCKMACSGDSTQKCGAGNRLSVTFDSVVAFGVRETYSTWSLLSCYTDSTSSRTLSKGESVTGGSSNMTIANCLNACTKSGLKYCGAEYAAECYGSNTDPSDSLLASGADPLSAGCSMPCKGNSTEACGGSNRILVYINNGTASS